jgi:hypothetical protein
MLPNKFVKQTISLYTLSRIKRQDFGPRQPANSGKVVAAKSGMWLI